jgi:hypothetical protein
MRPPDGGARPVAQAQLALQRVTKHESQVGWLQVSTHDR